MQKRLWMLLSGTSPSQVAVGMVRSATLQKLERRDAVEVCADYLCKYRDLLGYPDALAAGLPIATGIVEGACRYLVRDRMDKTGTRWSLAGAEAVLKLRALRANGDFEDYWRFHLNAEHVRSHAARYLHSEVPNPLTKPSSPEEGQVAEISIVIKEPHPADVRRASPSAATKRP